MWLILLLFSPLAHGSAESYLALRNQARCEIGCINQHYDSGFWSPKKKVCVCLDEIPLSDLFLKQFTLPSLPKSE